MRLPGPPGARDKLSPADESAAELAFPGFAVRRFFLGKQLDDDLIKRADKLTDLLQRHLGVGRHESKVPYLREPVRQHVLEVAAHELEDREIAGAFFLFAASPVTEPDPAVGNPEDPPRRDGDAEDILCEIRQCLFSIADVAAVDNPVGIPDAGRDFEPFFFGKSVSGTDL